MEVDETAAYLKLLVDKAVLPALKYGRVPEGYVEDPNDPEPRWMCYDQRQEIDHYHGYTPLEAVKGLYEMITRYVA